MEKFIDKNKKIEIIFKSQDFLIINKPANLLVHKTEKSFEPTLVDFLLKSYPEIKDVGENPLRAGIVHRLDKEVSGLMIIPLNQNAFNHFKNEFKNRKVEKEYLALVHGQVKKEGIITLPLVKDKGKILLAKSIDLEKIKESWTEYKVVKIFKDFTLLKIKTKTGRTHQIRIHLKSIGHPIVGDKKYKIKRQKIIDLGRIFLHAYKLGFYDLNNHWQEFQIDLPKELKDFLTQLE
jgi:23S rRNA pseudouridine1911/1915/1917 synthase